MDKVNVLIVSKLGLHRGHLEEIAAVNPCISVKDGTEQFVSELQRRGTKGVMVDLLKEQVSLECNQPARGTQESLDTMLAEAEVIFGVILFPEKLLLRAPRLRWIHIGGAGIDHYKSTGILDSNMSLSHKPL